MYRQKQCIRKNFLEPTDIETIDTNLKISYILNRIFQKRQLEKIEYCYFSYSVSRKDEIHVFILALVLTYFMENLIKILLRHVSKIN